MTFETLGCFMYMVVAQMLPAKHLGTAIKEGIAQMWTASLASFL